jgi:hypothetical protein
MKKLFTLLSILIFSLSAHTQSPEKMSYQAVVRNSTGALVTSQVIGLKISILQGSTTGSVIFSETYSPAPQTNANGLLTVEIGTGTASVGSFDGINWSNGPYFLKTETDPSGGTDYTISGVSQLLSVPYAMHSKNAESLTVPYPETDPVFGAHVAKGITSTLIGDWNTAFTWGNHAGLYRPVSYVPGWAEITGKPVFASVATSGSYNDLINKPAPYVAGPGIVVAGSTISSDLNLQVSETGDILTLNPGNSVFVPGISRANSSIPLVTSKAITNIIATKAYGSGNVLFYGPAAITETGICWSINQPPTVANSFIASGVFDGDFICVLEGLTANTVYFARAYAKTGGDTYYGETVMFSTPDVLPVPTLTTTEVSGITETTALSGGYISADGGSAVTVRGVCWNTSPAPTTANPKTTNGAGNGLFTSSMTGLTLNTKYYVRAYATNANGTNYGPELFFKTAGVLPTVTTNVPDAITASTAVLGGNVTAQGSATVTARGICLSTSVNPTVSDLKIAVGSGTGSYGTADARLKPNTAYYVRAFATNSVGTSYGENQTFTTLDADYISFENGLPSGFAGTWSSVVTGDAAEGYFSLYSNLTGDEATITRTLLSSGEISYWMKNAQSVNIAFYIDGAEQTTTNSGTWLKKSFPVTAGTHTFKWRTTLWGGAWIDYIILPK